MTLKQYKAFSFPRGK